MATDATYTDFLERKLVEWYVAPPKSDRHAPAHEDNGGEEGGVSPNGLINHCHLISKPKRTDRRRGRAVAAFDSNRSAFEPDRGRFDF